MMNVDDLRELDDNRYIDEDEVEAISNKYSLTPQEMVSIFFKHIVSKKGTIQI